MPGLNQSVVVGMDFLLREKAVIDFYRHVVHLGKDNRITVAILNHEVEQEDATELPSTGFSVENQEETQELFHTDTTKRREWKSRGKYRRCLQRGLMKPAIYHTAHKLSWPRRKAESADYRKLNDMTDDRAQEIQQITDALRDLGEARIITTLDLKRGYWHIQMDADSKKYTAFKTPTEGAFQFRFMPFGVKVGPSKFQKLMSQEVFAGYLNEFCIVYLDDIVVSARS
ncbi:hypothetical protein TKK_0005008 [Trichogramma kaykai]